MRDVVTAAFVLALGMSTGASDAPGQALAPPVSECSTNSESWDALVPSIQELFALPAFADGRQAKGLQTLSPTQSVSIWVATGPDCRNLAQDAVDAVNSYLNVDTNWRDVEYITAAIGPYILFFNLGWVGHANPVVVFKESDNSVHAVILTSF